jgi:superfamily II DNA or RNA helicase
MVANYERLPKLDADTFGAVVLDESSILKSFGGKTTTALCEAFRATPYKLAATATPAPNDHMEIGQHSDFLDVMPGQEMLSRWFIADQKKMGAYRLKGHAVESFWQWVASWSRCATLPSDLGGDDEGYILPEIERRVHEVSADRTKDVPEGMLFRIPEMSATSFHKEKRLTIQHRCEKAADLANHGEPVTVWCETNEESQILARLVNGAVEVHGSQSPEEKERRLMGFADGTYRAIVTKPKLAGFGVNWQHCAHAVFASISFSYEQHYQAVRRSHRFGQSRRVRNDIVISDTEAQVWNIVQRKSQDHDRMKREMAKAMKGAQSSRGLRVEYGSRDRLEFPAWLKSEGAA